MFEIYCLLITNIIDRSQVLLIYKLELSTQSISTFDDYFRGLINKPKLIFCLIKGKQNSVNRGAVEIYLVEVEKPQYIGLF